jgi:ligand-binding sensor domain-containing protein
MEQGLACILLAASTCAFALNPSLDINQYAHKSWTVRDGFFKSAIKTIAHTPDGYLWLGTDFGLLRFDGVKADPWQPPSAQHLPSNGIHKLLVARDGTLWIGTATGLASWKDGRLRQYAEFSGQVVSAVFEDHEGSVWAGALGLSNAKLCAMQNGGVQCYGQDGGLGRSVVSIYEDKGNLWVGASSGLWRWKPGTPKRYTLPREPEAIRSLIEGDKGSLWFGARFGISQLVNGKIEAPPLVGVGQVRVERLFRDRQGSVWIGTGIRAWRTCIRERWMRSRSPTAFPPITFTTFLRIVRAVFG